ncbi:MAG: hypothetical protein H0W96_00190 [Solirubrobacterales bacterium]|nr:hypothetical protein [Solirubrobacterales bacterium]
MLLLAPMALAHDPGQGEDAGTVAMRVTVTDGHARLTAGLPQDLCDSTQPTALVARRGGESLHAELTKRGCQLQGALRLPGRGRWFIYAEMLRDGRTVESWVAVSGDSGTRSVTEPARYAYFPSQRSDSFVKVAGGVVLYGAMLALLYATFVLIRASRRERELMSESVGQA